MAGLSSRWIIVLCFCFLLQQFAPAYTAHLSGNTLVMKSKRADEEEQEQEQEESQEYHHDQDEENVLQKRGKFSTLASWVWKGIKKTVNGIDKFSDVTSIATTVTRAIGGCEALPGGKGINALGEKFNQLTADYNKITKDIDVNILLCNNMRDYANFSYSRHEDVRKEIERLVTNQNEAFEAMDPRFKAAVNNATYKLEKMIKEKQGNKEEVDLLEVDRGYKRGLELAIDLALPSISLAMPYAGKLFKHLKTSVIGRNINKLQDRFGAFKILGSASDDTKRLLDGYESLGTTGKSNRFLAKLDRIMDKIKPKYRKVAKIVGVIKSGLKKLLTIGSAALNIWTTIKDFEDCGRKKTEAQNSVDQMEEFIEKNQLLLNDAKDALKETKKALQDIYDVAWDSKLLKALGLIKEMVSDTEYSKPRPDVDEILTAIENYLGGSMERADELYGLQDRLRLSLSPISYSYKCFKAKGDFRTNVNNYCAEGKSTFEGAYDLFVTKSGNENEARDCKESSGELYITIDKLRDSWNKFAKEDGSVNSICLLNKYHDKIEEQLMYGETDPSIIAKELAIQGEKGVNDEIEAAIKTFPSVDELPLPDQIKSQICSMRKWIKKASDLRDMVNEDERMKREVTIRQVEDILEECDN